MSDLLHHFLTKTRRNLAHLPPDERERRLDAVSEQLAHFVAVRLEQGMDEETATAEAVREFETGYHDAFTADGTQSARFGSGLSPIVVAVLYCAVANKAVALLVGSLFQLITGFSLPSLAGVSVQMFVNPTPSLLLATLAAVVLVLREGLPKIASTLVSSKTIEGNGARWTALNQGFIFLIGLAIILLLNNGWQDSPIFGLIVLVLLLFMLAAPFAAGWIVARAVPKAGLAGVQIAAVTGALLSFADQCIWLFDLDNGMEFVLRIVLFLFALLGQALLITLAILGAYLGSHDTSKIR